MVARLVYDVHGIHSEGFRQDRKVLDYLEFLNMVDERISNHELRKKYFNDFLHSLSIREVNDLMTSSLKSVSSLLIEIAINYRYGIEVDILDEVDAEEMNENVGRMCDFLHYRDHINIKFYLVRWQYYQEQRYHLEESEKENATAFFNVLYTISVEDRKLLSEKYYGSTVKANYDVKRDVYRIIHTH